LNVNAAQLETDPEIKRLVGAEILRFAGFLRDRAGKASRFTSAHTPRLLVRMGRRH
jgi:hypothetical protein